MLKPKLATNFKTFCHSMSTEQRLWWCFVWALFRRNSKIAGNPWMLRPSSQQSEYHRPGLMEMHRRTFDRKRCSPMIKWVCAPGHVHLNPRTWKIHRPSVRSGIGDETFPKHSYSSHALSDQLIHFHSNSEVASVLLLVDRVRLFPCRFLPVWRLQWNVGRFLTIKFSCETCNWFKSNLSEWEVDVCIVVIGMYA